MTKLSECEEQVMVIVWNSEEAPDLNVTLAAVNEKFGHEWKPQTVSTFLTRLVKKGFLSTYRKGRYSYYTPLVSLGDYRREQISDLVKLLYEGDVKIAKKDLE